MKYVVFTKYLRALGIEKLADSVHSMGLDGVDLCVRDGYPVNPGNARSELPRAVKRFRESGLVTPLISASTALVDPASSETERLFGAAHDAGVRNVKIGYWGFRAPGYWKQVDRARKSIEAFGALGARLGVRACLHTHSGSNLGVNAAALMHLLQGFDPRYVGAYLDPGHLALNGEPFPLAADMASNYLCLIAIKDSVWLKPAKPGGQRRSHFVPLGEGMVDWGEALRSLRSLTYEGPLSLHSEYDGLSVEQVIEQTRRDAAWLRRVEAGLPDARNQGG